MFVLHVEMEIKPGLQHALEKTYVETFRPAISRQEGFSAMNLLRPSEDGDYRLSIAFDSQPLQQKWVATDVHQQVWPLMENHCSAYSVRYYNTVE
ncbi:MAG TPA: antibiotic biosynthesis monooxygenase [Terriglobia bacterium]|nr:antibiotic biosynthesis monooxygenase [Terriglobia bacterium]